MKCINVYNDGLGSYWSGGPGWIDDFCMANKTLAYAYVYPKSA